MGATEEVTAPGLMEEVVAADATPMRSATAAVSCMVMLLLLLLLLCTTCIRGKGDALR